MQRALNLFAGLLVGALVGATLGLLLAPSSGKDLRDDIQTRADQIANDFQSTVNQEREKLEKELEALKKGEIKVA